MKIGIIGPSKIESLESVNSQARMILGELAEEIMPLDIYVVPDKGSVSEYFAKSYLERGGSKVFTIIPLDDKEFGYDWINMDLGEHVNCGTWRNQPEKLNEETDALLCLGYSVGVLSEIAYSKWFNPKPIYIIKELVSGELPSEIKGLDLRYISYKDFLAKEL